VAGIARVTGLRNRKQRGAVMSNTHVKLARLGLHAHTCSECLELRPCYAKPCEARTNANVCWTCSLCAAISSHEVSPQLDQFAFGGKL